MYFSGIIFLIMIQIWDKIVSLDLFEQKFFCNLDLCKGNCCIHGDSGAPLSEEETLILEEEYDCIRNHLTEKGNRTIQMNGRWLMDKDGDKVTPLIEGIECAYAVFEDGIARCGIENAWKKGKTRFRKPVSCHLYPVRISKVGVYTALNYHQWSVCKPALDLGSSRGIPVYKFLKDAIIRAYGIPFFREMDKVAKQLKSRSIG
jgi:hypothetical protein